MTSEVGELLAAAVDDRVTLSLPLPDRIFGFHAQQAVEKLLKVLIAAHGQTFPWTHDLSVLLKIVLALGEQVPLPAATLLSLQPYATIFRYSDGPSLDDATRKTALETVDVLLGFVRERLQRLTTMP